MSVEVRGGYCRKIAQTSKVSTAMKQKYDLNRDFVRTLQPTGEPQEFTDRTIAGFSVRVTPAGAISYALRYRKPDGSFARKKIGNYPELSPADAREIVKRELQTTDRKGDSAAVAAERRERREREAKRSTSLPTVRQFLNDPYEDWLKANAKAVLNLPKLSAIISAGFWTSRLMR